MDEFVEVNKITDEYGIVVKLPCMIKVPKALMGGSEREVYLHIIKELCKKIEVQNG
jgi:hypothetical protein